MLYFDHLRRRQSSRGNTLLRDHHQFSRVTPVRILHLHLLQTAYPARGETLVCQFNDIYSPPTGIDLLNLRFYSTVSSPADYHPVYDKNVDNDYDPTQLHEWLEYHHDHSEKYHDHEENAGDSNKALRTRRNVTPPRR